MVNHGYDPTKQRKQMARAALDRAVHLAPEAPEVWLARGEYHYFVHLDYEKALDAFEMAEQGMPANPELLADKGFVLRRHGRWDEALASFEQALQLQPQEVRSALFLAETCFMMRRYREAMQHIDLTIALAPDEHTGYRMKAHLYWNWTADLTVARAVLNAVPAALRTRPEVLHAWFQQELYEGNYPEALGHLSEIDDVWLGLAARPKPLLEAFAYDLMREPEQARLSYEATRRLVEWELEGHPRDDLRYPALHSVLGLAYAGLGRTEEAMREGEEALAFRPVSKDALLAPQRLADLALIYTMVGEHDAALDQLETLLTIPSWLSAQILLLDPGWAPLHGYPRFQALVEKAER